MYGSSLTDVLITADKLQHRKTANMVKIPFNEIPFIENVLFLLCHHDVTVKYIEWRGCIMNHHPKTTTVANM